MLQSAQSRPLKTLGDHSGRGDCHKVKKKKQMQRAKQGLTAARLITTWQPAALARKKAAFPQCNTGQSRQEAAGKTTKFMGVCLARKRRHLCWCSRHNNSVDPKHIRERKRKEQHRGMEHQTCAAGFGNCTWQGACKQVDELVGQTCY